MSIIYKTNGKVCAETIEFDIKDDKIYGLNFSNGCKGHRVAVSKLVEGMETKKVISLLDGIPCGNKGTSCADQLAQALKKGV
jgi:uncharacterized protein (TIGR03905 family)